jgi:orotidine-5'-phosphate decarboxylase
MISFKDKLRAAQERNHSWLCVGLDPDPTQLPPSVGLAGFCRQIIEATADAVCAFKPNLAFFLAGGSEGIAALEEVIKAVPADIPVVLDCKSGDIGSTQRLYGEAAFGRWGVDAMTVLPYVGEDAVLPLLEAFPGRGLYVVCRSSNPDARRFQDHPGTSPRLLDRVAENAVRWADAHPAGTVGLVAGGTFPEDIELLRRVAPGLPFLVPGFGAQGGGLDAAVRHGATADGIGPLINVSRGVMYASRGADFAEAARKAACDTRDEINRLRGHMGKSQP